MQYIDCHTHSDNSFDGKSSLAHMCAKAFKLGLSVYAITDHFESNMELVPEFDFFKAIDTSVKQAESLKAIYEKKGLTVLTGIELGQAVQNSQNAKKALEYNYDMVIGSLHNNKGEEDFYFIPYKEMTLKEIYDLLERYFSELFEISKLSFFDTLAHLNYPLRYIIGNHKIDVDITRFYDIISEILKTLIRNDKSLELNTSGLRQNIKDFLPGKDIMKLYYDLGGRLVTIGSDAHNTEDLAKGIKEGYELLGEIGFSHITYYKERKPCYIELK